MSERLFSYGTLQSEAVQIASFGRILAGRRDAMIGYRLDWLEITDRAVLDTSGERFHPIISPSSNPEDRVEGMVFQIMPEELAAADRYEVEAYRRVRVTLASGEDAWAYLKA